MSSQQGMSIEIRQSAMASERVSPPQIPINVITQREVAHTQEELTETGESSILRIASSVISPSMDTLPSQVLGEGAVITANPSTAPTSPGKTHPDASADSGADIGAVRQPIGNESDLPDEPKGKVTSPSQERTEDLIPNVTASVTPPEIPTLKESSTDDRELALSKDGDLRTPIAPLLTSLRMAPVISLAGTLEARSIERSETPTVRLSETPNLEPSERVTRETQRAALSETPTEPNSPDNDTIIMSALHAILKDRDAQFLKLLDKRDRQFHQVMTEKDRLLQEELAKRDATIVQLTQRCNAAEQELEQVKRTMQTVKDRNDFNTAVIGMRLGFVEGILKSKSTQAPILKDNPTEGEIRGEEAPKKVMVDPTEVQAVKDKGKVIAIPTDAELRATKEDDDSDDSEEKEKDVIVRNFKELEGSMSTNPYARSTEGEKKVEGVVAGTEVLFHNEDPV